MQNRRITKANLNTFAVFVWLLSNIVEWEENENNPANSQSKFK